ncbi:hypothetical protein PP175_27140 (plasmid) [Aneurinibacillus sp. Ricciae_BoGa-3]|uniref:hypothetical protein n=1 Tax=Aneurinibacillus sp. Ricciae_BoGa-3 TaxID=3022697 RepID=UPI00233FF369|nr:hypothetical protein [Aneurinibacillus sp. Ricciae_BoGa-3]WCK57715.1 hypothetical protein PP175_27140 [Aneurinibacillus sp. Ricciae_BoGa-3]
MRIPDSTMQNIWDNVNGSLEKKYNQYLYSGNGIEFQTYYNKTLTTIFNTLDLEHLFEVTSDTLSPIVKRRQKTKKRWLDRELNSEGLFYKEIEVVAKGLFEQFQDEPEKFKAVYQCDTYEELKVKRLAELRTWLEMDDIPVSDFPYLKDKQRFQIQKAFDNDIEYIALKLIKEECPFGMQSAIVALPNSMSNIPIDFTNRIRMNQNPILSQGKDQFFSDMYHIDDNTVLESLVNVEILRTGVIASVLKTLNAMDVKIFLSVMTKQDENFFTTREILVDIGDVVRDVYTSDSQKSYMSVKESLLRMAHLQSGLVSDTLRGFTVKIFDNVDIAKATNSDKEVAKIVVNIDIVNQYIKNQTINMYRDRIDRFELDSAKIAIFPLQRERIRCSMITKPGKPLVFQANINFFRGILYFSNKKKRENIKIIEKMLAEIKRNEITLKDFHRQGDTFFLEFYEIDNRERKDLLNYKETRVLLTEEATALLTADEPYEQMKLNID